MINEAFKEDGVSGFARPLTLIGYDGTRREVRGIFTMLRETGGQLRAAFSKSGRTVWAAAPDGEDMRQFAHNVEFVENTIGNPRDIGAFRVIDREPTEFPPPGGSRIVRLQLQREAMP